MAPVPSLCPRCSFEILSSFPGYRWFTTNSKLGPYYSLNSRGSQPVTTRAYRFPPDQKNEIEMQKNE